MKYYIRAVAKIKYIKHEKIQKLYAFTFIWILIIHTVYPEIKKNIKFSFTTLYGDKIMQLRVDI